MDEREARARVEDIRLLSHDDEAAHSEEDEARADFLRAVMSGQYDTIEEASRVAAILLETHEFDFES